MKKNPLLSFILAAIYLVLVYCCKGNIQFEMRRNHKALSKYWSGGRQLVHLCWWEIATQEPVADQIESVLQQHWSSPTNTDLTLKISLLSGKAV